MANSDILNAYFEKLLGHAIDSNSLALYSNQLGSGDTFQFVASEIDSSTAAYTDQVGAWFEKYLGRAASAGESSGFVTELRSSATFELAQSQIIGSAEYFADAGSTNAGFVTKLYSDLLSRTPSGQELAIWESVLNSETRQQVAFILLSSTEYRTDLVHSWFETFLDRAPTALESSAYVNALAGGSTDQALISGILGSSEFIADNTPCYCRGTRILAERGEAAVEDLEIGDRVVTLSGVAKPVKWIGRRSFSGQLVARNRDVLPIVIRAGALAHNVPSRDLHVSPEHALYIDGLLIAARHLVNGASIVQPDTPEAIEYFHIELESHDVIFAEGAPAESYLDCSNRRMFQNWHEYGAVDPGEAQADGRSCAPRPEDGDERIASTWMALARRAGISGDALMSAMPLNRMPNPELAGAAPGVLGEGGALPVGWQLDCAAGLSFEVLGTGEESGMRYVDLRITGAPLQRKSQLWLAGGYDIAARAGERWRVGAQLMHLAGSSEHLGPIELGTNLCRANGRYSSWFDARRMSHETRDFASARVAFSKRIDDPACEHLQPLIQFNWAEGQTVDITLRIGGVRAVRIERAEGIATAERAA